MDRIKVMIVDDSFIIREVIKEILHTSDRIEVVASCADALSAKEKLIELRPDVITLDIIMPKIDGITFLKEIMHDNPTPVIMISSLTDKGNNKTIEALEEGAVDFVYKPKDSGIKYLTDYSEELIKKVIEASNSNVKYERINKLKKLNEAMLSTPSKDSFLIGIGASTGGVEAIKCILNTIPKNCPPIIIVQHIGKNFAEPLTNRMNKISAANVKLAEDSEILSNGNVYIAPEGRHVKIISDSGNYYIKLVDLQPVNRHRPSIDFLFESIAKVAGKRSVGVILTGMGKDGANGLLAIKQASGYTICQDEKTSIIWGMPREAVKIDAAMQVLPLNKITECILEVSNNSK